MSKHQQQKMENRFVDVNDDKIDRLIVGQESQNT